jgi:TetR/AcrR family transcriptional regulator, cholesterol catabolism regulator
METKKLWKHLNQNLFPMFIAHTFASNMTAETKNNILQRTEILFFKYGVKSVTMDDIARELGISKKTLYQFFENKNDLIAQMLQVHDTTDEEVIRKCFVEATDAVDELVQIGKHAMGEVSKLMTTHNFVYDLQKYHREVWEKFEHSMKTRTYEGVKHNIERGIREGLYRADVDADVIAKLYVGKMFFIIDEDNFPNSKYNKWQVFIQNWIYHVHGIGTAKGIALFDEKVKILINQ